MGASLGPYRRLMPYVARYRWRLVFGFVAGALYAAANGGLIWVIREGLSDVFGEDTMGAGGLLIVAVLFFPIVGLLRGVADFLSRYTIRWVGNRVVMDLRNDMFAHLHDLSASYFSRSRTGELISRTANDTVLVEQAVSNVIIDLVKQPMTLVAMVAWTFVLDARLALISFVVFPICVVPISMFGLRVRRHTKVAQEQIADVITILQETISGVRIVKAFGMEDYETKRFFAKTRVYFERIMRVTGFDASVEPIVMFIAMMALSGVLVYVRWTDMAVGEFVAFATALFMLYEPVKKIGRIHIRLQQSAAAAERVLEVLDTEVTVAERPDAHVLDGKLETISFEDVAFRYEDSDEDVIRGISLDVKRGERVAFVGGSGSGKTTLVNLVPRFYDVTGGRIAINGRDVRDVTLASLRGMIGLVTQETFLFNDTVGNNISYGCQGATQAAVEEAAQRAHAHEFIMDMPDGYDTEIGERGVRLSGGQRQRLAIARAIMRNPPILILDEATSALDTESERMVQAALDALMRGRTVLAIAHRLSTIASCDRILVLADGGIIEQGTHDELMALKGQYRRLYDMQFEI